jgi:hypothetical protein
MAQSMYEVIENGMIEVNHNGEDAEFMIPEWLEAASGKLESEADLLEWAKEHKVLHALLHAGIAHTIIDLRAVIRPADKAGKEKGEKIKVSMLKDFDAAQARSDGFKIKPKARPGTGGSGSKAQAEQETLTKVVKAMIEGGIDTATIHALQDPVFGKAKVALAINNAQA